MTDDLNWKKRMTSLSLERFCKALPAPSYDVRIIFPDNRARTRRWDSRQLVSADVVGFLRAKNMGEDAAIYIRPSLPNYAMIDFDDDGYERLRRMVEDKMPVKLAVETSPYHVQAWLRLGSKIEVTVDDQATRAREFAERYGGDMGSANQNQLGRAPGFFNRKPQYRGRVGHYPLVQQIPHRLGKLRSTSLHGSDASGPLVPLAQRAARAPGVKGRTSDAALEHWIDSIDASREDWSPKRLVDDHGAVIFCYSPPPDLGTARTAYARALECMADQGYKPRVRTDGQVDRSYQDFDVAGYILMCGYETEFAAAAIACGSEKAAERKGVAQYNYASGRVTSAEASLSTYRWTAGAGTQS